MWMVDTNTLNNDLLNSGSSFIIEHHQNFNARFICQNHDYNWIFFHYSVDFIFLSFGIMSFIYGTLKLLEGH